MTEAPIIMLATYATMRTAAEYWDERYGEEKARTSDSRFWCRALSHFSRGIALVAGATFAASLFVKVRDIVNE